jgi:hypothetical protein
MSNEPEELKDKDFQAVLKALLAVYEPLLQKEVDRAKSPASLEREAGGAPPGCDEEIDLANRLFEAFFTEKVALQLLPAQAREILGPVERWRWCLLHIRCCIIFGWLVCRGPRTFRSVAYYLYRFWRCVREAIGSPVGAVLTDEQRGDLRTLVEALASAYKPYLSGQLAGIEFAQGLPEELLSGKIDCHTGEEDVTAVFERLLTAQTAPALLGRTFFETHRQDPFFWFCRCWCLCAIRFGCCLARVDSLVDVLWCLVDFWRCIRDCFRPLYCELTGPAGCVSEQPNFEVNALVVPVIGSAAGTGFDHYILEWSSNGTTWHTTGFFYPPIPPGTATQGTAPVVAGLLGYFDTTFQNAGTYFIRVTVHDAQGAVTAPCEISFSLFKQDVAIRGVDGYFNLDTFPPDPAARFVETVPALCSSNSLPQCNRATGVFEVSFADCISIEGGAFVGGCEGRTILNYRIDYKPGFETNPLSGGWTNVWSVNYTTPAQYRSKNLREGTDVLTSVWGPDCIFPPFPPPCIINDPQGQLYPSCWQTVLNPNCQLSGLITLRLVVEDTAANLYYDTQRVWIDNKRVSALIEIAAVPKCADLFVSGFANPPDCATPWNVPLVGIAYDEYIDETLPLTRPNDNFDYYTVSVEKQGGPTITLPVCGPDPKGNCCFYGTNRVGDPGTRCGVVVGPQVLGTLANFDLRSVDPVCKDNVACITVPADFTIPRGECCVYIFHLFVIDRTITSGPARYTTADWPVKICNDLKA